VKKKKIIFFFNTSLKIYERSSTACNDGEKIVELLTTDQAAKFFPDIKPDTLRQWRQIPGRGPNFVKVGPRVFYPRDAVENFIAALPRLKSTLEIK